MKQEDLFRKVGNILKELNGQYEFLAQHPHQINELELALFQANADFLSDHVRILMKVAKPSPIESPPLTISEQDPGTRQVEDTEDRSEELNAAYYGDSVQEIQQIEALTFAPDSEELFKIDDSPSTFEFILGESIPVDESPEEEVVEEQKLPSDLADSGYIPNQFRFEENHLQEEKFEFEEKPVDELFNRPLSQEEENILAQKRRLTTLPLAPIAEDEDDEIGPEPFLVTKPAVEASPIIKEDLTLIEAEESKISPANQPLEDPGYKPTLNDLLAAKTDRSQKEKIPVSPISDLKQGINLNDKLLYIKDLFNGYNLAYAEAIEIANKLPNFEAADAFFSKNYAEKYDWANKQATVDKFYNLLNQRFKL